MIGDLVDVRTRSSAGLSDRTCTSFSGRSFIPATESRVFFLQCPFADHHEAQLSLELLRDEEMGECLCPGCTFLEIHVACSGMSC